MPSSESKIRGLDSARSALQACVASHGNICTQSRSHLLQPEDTESPHFIWSGKVTVLNVDTLQIEEISLGDTFLALSYVFGRSPDIGSWEHVNGSGTKWIRSDELPPTLADAITLCRDLDQKHLWVDQICINQKDPAEFTSSIHNMDRIYASALATVIVACNNCVDEKIASYKEAPRDSHTEPWQEQLQH